MNTQTDSDPEISEAPAETVPEAAAAVPTPEEEVAKYRDLALRSRAELDNYRKRMAREKEEAIRYANVSLLETLMPILDNFELGLDAARNSQDAAGIVMGLGMVRKQFEDFLRDNGVEIVAAEGQPFDPNVHEAVANENSSDVPEGQVIRQLRRGFKLKDRLIRPATVVVSKGPSA